MKKWQTLGLLLGLFSSTAPFQNAMAVEGTDHALKKIAYVESRGIMNAAAIPLEIPLTAVRERREHRFTWPFTYIPKLFTNIAMRLTSATYDVFVYPWISPVSEDITPLTEQMGYQNYSFQGDEQEF